MYFSDPRQWLGNRCSKIHIVVRSLSLNISYGEFGDMYAIVPLNVKATSLNCSTRLLNQPQSTSVKHCEIVIWGNLPANNIVTYRNIS